jgi:hypothetical protein
VGIFAYFGARKSIDRLVANLQSAANSERRLGNAETWGPLEDQIATIQRRARIFVPLTVLIGGAIGAGIAVFEYSIR